MTNNNFVMDVYYDENGERKHRPNLTLVEQTGKYLYLENESDAEDTPQNTTGKLQKVENCKNIGFINFNKEEISEISEKRLSENVDKCVYLQDIKMAEQIRDNKIHVVFTDNHEISVSGNLDRAYTY